MVTRSSNGQLDGLINSFIVEEDLKAQEGFAKNIAESFPLIHIVKGLEDSLTQEDSLVRAKATQCLADVVKFQNDLNSQELQVLSVFLSDRLQDQNSVSPAAQGLRTLTEKSHYKHPNHADKEFWSKLREIDMLHLDANTKYEVYLLMDSLSKDLSVSFVDTFTALAAGEKDPRNLMLNLNINRRILDGIGLNLPREKRAEIYDITFCYFPVKFHPPKDMPYKISGAEIRDALSQTLSSPAIAEWTVPGFISKLTAVNLDVKKDSLNGLEMTLNRLNVEGDVDSFWEPVWDGIKYEILHGTPENETYGPSVQVLSKFITNSDFLNSVLAEFDPENLSKSKLCQLCHLVTGISVNEDTWNTLAPKAVEKSYQYLEALNILLNTSFPLPHPDQILQALLTGLANGEKRDSIHGLSKLALNQSGFEYVPLIVQTLTQESAYSSLTELAAVHPTSIKEHCIPLLVSQIPESLDALAQICCVRPLVQVLAVRLLGRLHLDRTEFDSEHVEPLKLLNTLVESVSHLKSSSDLLGFDRIVMPTLIEKFRQGASASDSVIDAASILIERAAQGVPPPSQQTYAARLTKEFGHIHFHLILNGIAPMQAYPFDKTFLQSQVIPRLQSTQDILERAAYLRLIALVANKWPEELEFGLGASKSLSSFFEARIRNQETREPNDLEIFAWLTKGLIFRADKQGFENANALIELAPSDPQVARVFGVLAAEDRILSKANGCILRPLFRQRLFVMSIKSLSENSESTESLVALSNLLKYTPQAVLGSYFGQILPMLLSSLETNSPRLQGIALDTLRASLPGSSETLVDRLAGLVPKIIKIATSALSFTTRSSAVQLIIALKEALPEQMSEFKDQILDGLVPALGDGKRDVRRHAVKCRQLFY